MKAHRGQARRCARRFRWRGKGTRETIHGFWLIVIAWTFGLLERVLLTITHGRASWLNTMFYVDPMVDLAWGLGALFIAYSGQMRVRYRIILVLTRLAWLFAAALGLFTGLTPYGWVQWPTLELTVLALRTAMEAVWIFAANILGLAGTTGTIRRFLILCIPVLPALVIFSDLKASPNFLFLVGVLAVLMVSYRKYTYAVSII